MLRDVRGGASSDVEGGASRDVSGGASSDVEGGASRDVRGGASNALDAVSRHNIHILVKPGWGRGGGYMCM